LSLTITVADRCPVTPGAKRIATWQLLPFAKVAPLVQVVVAELMTKLLPMTVAPPITIDALLRSGLPIVIIRVALAVLILRFANVIVFGV